MQTLNLGSMGDNALLHVVGGSWFLSALLIASLLIYPLLYAKRNLFVNVIAPIVFVLTLGYFAINYEHLSFIDNEGILRAICEMCLGIISYNIYDKFKHINCTIFLQAILTVVELGCYISVIAYYWNHSHSQYDFIAILLLAIGITISYSAKSLTHYIFKGSFFNYLGKLSLGIYVTHLMWIRLLGWYNMPLGKFGDIFLVLILSITSASFGLALIDLLKYLLKGKLGKKLKRLFIKESA